MTKVSHKKLKPPISYYGGKQRLASKIVKYLPKHTVYVEPFCGGAAVFFAKPLPRTNNSHHYRECLNDLDGQLINFYRVMQSTDRRFLLPQIMNTAYSREEYELAQFICNAIDGEYTSIERAWGYYVNLGMSFANKYGGGWSVSVYSHNSAATWENRKRHILKTAYRLKGVAFECKDALDVIRQWDSPQTLFYCDPPYINAEQGYKYTYSVDQYRELVSVLRRIKGSFVLSGYDNPYVPLNWPVIKFNARMSAANGCRRKDTARIECLWVVDRSENVRPAIKKLFATGKYDCFCGIHGSEK